MILSCFNILIVLPFKLWSVIHLEFFVCDGVRYEPAPFTEKKYSFLWCHFCFKSGDHFCVGLIPLVFLYLP